MNKDAEFRGTDNLWFARLTKDDATGYTFETPVCITTTGQIQKKPNSSSETHYYSNVGSIVITTNGGDTVTVNTPVLDLDKVALITGMTYDATTKALVTGDIVDVPGALIYREQLTDDTWRYVVKYNASLTAFPEEISQTRSNGVNTNGQQIVFKCNKTVYSFSKGGHVDGIELDERDVACDFSTFFDTVYTPDTIGSIAKSAVTALSLSASTSSLTVGDEATITATVVPSGSPVSWATSNGSVATVQGGVITAVGAGVAVITATAGAYSAQCTVTVSAE